MAGIWLELGIGKPQSNWQQNIAAKRNRKHANKRSHHVQRYIDSPPLGYLYSGNSVHSTFPPPTPPFLLVYVVQDPTKEYRSLTVVILSEYACTQRTLVHSGPAKRIRYCEGARRSPRLLKSCAFAAHFTTPITLS